MRLSRLLAGRTVRGFGLGLLVLALFLALGAGPPAKSVVLETIADAHIVTDNADAEDTQGLRSRNFGSLDFIRTWYVWHVVDKEEVVSLGLFKFDLTSLKGKEVKSAHLQLFGIGATLTQPARLVDVHAVSEGDWTEGELTFLNRPTWTQNPVATTAVYGPGVWYSWDVSGSVIRESQRAEKISFVTGLRAIDDKKEELVLFASREVGRNAPRLIVTYDEKAAFPLYLWAGGLGGLAAVAVLAFLGGRLQTGRRRRAAREEMSEDASPITDN